MPRAEVERAPVECYVHVVATDVMRVWVSGRADVADTAEIDRRLRDVEERAAVILLDLRAAPMTAALRALVEVADTRARTLRRRLVILEDPDPGDGSELVTLGLTARIMSLADRSGRDRAESRSRPL